MHSWLLNYVGLITSSSKPGPCSTWCSPSDPRSPGPPVTTHGTQVIFSFIVPRHLIISYLFREWLVHLTVSHVRQFASQALTAVRFNATLILHVFAIHLISVFVSRQVQSSSGSEFWFQQSDRKWDHTDEHHLCCHGVLGVSIIYCKGSLRLKGVAYPKETNDRL